MPPKTPNKTRKTEAEILQEERNNRALAMEIAATTSKKALDTLTATLAIYDRLDRDADGVALTDQRELVEHLKMSANMAKQLGLTDDSSTIFGVYDRVFGETLEEKVDAILDVVADDDDGDSEDED